MLAMSFAAEFPLMVEQLILLSPGCSKDVYDNLKIVSSNFEHALSSEELNRYNHLSALVKTNEADSLERLERKRLLKRSYVYVNPIPDSLFQKISVTKNPKTDHLIVMDLEKFDISNTLNNYKGQVQIITGRQDIIGFFSYEIKIERPSAKLNWIDKCGHFPMFEKPDEFYKVLFNILDNK